MEQKDLRDKEWLKTLKTGCRATFTSIYNEYWYPMFVLAFRKVEVKETAEEMVQEIFTRLWRDREKLEVTNLSAYLFSSVRYEVIDHIRKNIQNEGYQKYYRAFCLNDNSSTEDAVYYNDLANSLNNVVMELPLKTREVFYYSRMEHWPAAKIAKHLSITEKTVEYHLARATRFMRGALKEHLVGIILAILYFTNNFIQINPHYI